MALQSGPGVRDFRRYDPDWTGLAKLAEAKPEFFLYVGHGNLSPGYEELGPFLQMRAGDGGTERLTSYDIALRVRLPRNRLTILGACLAGQGAQTAGGDVVGFLRGFMAAAIGSFGQPEKLEGITDIVPTPVAEFERMIRDGELTDGFLLAAYGMAKARNLI